MRDAASGFTLLELLVVLAIVAILAVVVITTINPNQLLKQSRDSQRISDLATLKHTISIYALAVGDSLGAASTVYVSIPDTSATCANLGLPSLPGGWSYHCAPQSSYRKVDGTGWLPLNFSQISFGSPLSILPADPTNTTTTLLYYTYAAGTNGEYEVAALLESAKYQTKESTDGGADPASYEQGSDLTLAPFMHGLVGFWNFDEGAGTNVLDSSGIGNNGTWNGTSTTRYVTGKVGNFAGTFNGTNDYVRVPYNSSFGGSYGYTMCGWEKTTSSNAMAMGGIQHAHQYFGINDLSLYFYIRTISVDNQYILPVSIKPTDGNWHNICAEYSSVDGLWRGYVDGTQSATRSIGGILSTGITDTALGARAEAYNVFFNGALDEMRFYNRALSAAEIKAIYNATK